MEVHEDKPSGIVVVALRPGDLLLESLGEVARKADIHSGVVLSGIGSLTHGRIHTVSSNDYPPSNDFIDLEGPLEVVQFGGIIANYEPHIHISLWDRERRFHGGHLEEGCAVLALAELSIRRLPELRLTRRPLDATGIMFLGAE
ncbi:MAG TPA: PPC domain-containing DNA-binding protein [Chloroflexota bacterium]|nr:PPC domain-containing DNA-binding protein [Chloroflexota bacterium]